MRLNKTRTQPFMYCLLAMCILTLNTATFAKSIALSFDDGLNPSLQASANEYNAALLQHLSEAKLQAIIFPSYIKIGDLKGKALIRDWGMRGHLIANHSAWHQNLNKDDMSSKDYIKSIEINAAVFSDLPNYTARYRYPYLKEGNTALKRDQVQAWLQNNGYQNGAVSIDASDWFYNQKYLAFLKQNDLEKIQRLKSAYLAHLLDRANYYDALAIKVLNRSPKHVLLLHTNAINAAFLGDIIEHFQVHAWTFISAHNAFQDPLYQVFSQNIPAGESIIWSIAKSQGVEDLRYPAEDSPYELDNLRQHQLID